MQRSICWQLLLKAKLTLQAWEQTISESFASFEIFAPDHQLLLILKVFFFPWNDYTHGKHDAIIPPHSLLHTGNMETYVCLCFRYYYDRIILFFSQEHMLMLKWMHHIHLLSFVLKTSFFFPLLFSLFQLALLCFLLISLLDSPSSQGHPCLKSSV